MEKTLNFFSILKIPNGRLSRGSSTPSGEHFTLINWPAVAFLHIYGEKISIL
jgi:hypothetical protein